MAAVSTESISSCELHQSEEVRFYCEECRIMICDDCIVGGHRNHKSIKLKEFGAKRRITILKAAEEAESTKIPKIETAIQQARDRQTHFSKSVEREANAVRQKRLLLNGILDELQSELMEILQESDREAKQDFQRFIKKQELKKKKIKEIVEDIKSKGTEITDTEVAKYDVKLDELNASDPYSDTVPSLQPPHHHFNDEFATKEKLQHFIGYIETDSYATVGSDEIPEVPNRNIPVKEGETSVESANDAYLEPTKRYTDLMCSQKRIFQTIASFDLENSVSYIVPKEEMLKAWIIENYISEVDCSGTKLNPKLLKTLDQKVISACTNKNNELLIGFQDKPSLKLLQVVSNKITKSKSYSLVGSFSVTSGKNNLQCICRSPTSADDHVACLQDTACPEKYIVRWYSNGKPTNKDLSLTSANIDVECPIQICQHPDGLICIVCRPANSSSWIIIIDSNGDQKLRYPPKQEKKENEKAVDFVGAGFLKETTITISDKANNEQLLINLEGQCIQKDKYDVMPSFCCVDLSDNLWVAFENGRIKVINYRQDHEYTEVRINTPFKST